MSETRDPGERAAIVQARRRRAEKWVAKVLEWRRFFVRLRCFRLTIDHPWRGAVSSVDQALAHESRRSGRDRSCWPLPQPAEVAQSPRRSDPRRMFD